MWRHTETDERYRTKFDVFRCSHCSRLAVTERGKHPADPCVCLKRR